MKREPKLYNVMFPLWALMFFPQTWIFVLPGNFIVDSIVLIVAMFTLKLSDKKLFYKMSIFKIFLFGLLADVLGSIYMWLMIIFEIGSRGDDLFVTVPGLVIAAVFIFIFNYYISFKNCDNKVRFRFALIFAVFTAPYTFLVPSSMLY